MLRFGWSHSIQRIETLGLARSAMIHLFNGFMNPFGGSDLEALELFRLLGESAEVRLWATSSRASRELLAQYPISRPSPLTGNAPNGGTYVFLGAHWRNKVWPYLIPRPRRLIYVFNTFHPKIPELTTTMPRLLGWPRAEFVCISEFQKRLLQLDGVVHPSPIDIERFMPSPASPKRPFTVGRLSRDIEAKHHSDDIEVYEALLAEGGAVRIQGGTLLKEKLSRHPQADLLPEGQFAAEDFLSTLDVFYYRTGTHVETFGRVVLEAMACGVPVVCHRHGGYADHIRHGENGFLFETTEEAKQTLAILKADLALRTSIGENARRTVEGLFSQQAIRERLSFYLS